MSHQQDYLASFSRLLVPGISKVQRLLTPLLEKALIKPGISLAEFRIVGMLMGEEAGLSQKQLAEKLGISSASLSVSIGKLEKKNWIVRINDGQDQRIKRIALAPNANFADINDLIMTLESRATAGISAKDLQTTRGVLEKMAQNISQTAAE